MATIIGIAGSLRRDSYNAALLRACAELAPSSLRIEIESIAGIPLYDGDIDRERGAPEPVARLKDRIAKAAGLLVVTPEYNHSLPGVLKNAIDWLSRPPKDIPRVFGGKPVALLGATPGRGGTRFAQAAWLPVFQALGMHAWFGKQVYVAGIDESLDAQGRLVDPDLTRLVSTFLEGFAEFVETTTRARSARTE